MITEHLQEVDKWWPVLRWVLLGLLGSIPMAIFAVWSGVKTVFPKVWAFMESIMGSTKKIAESLDTLEKRVGNIERDLAQVQIEHNSRMSDQKAAKELKDFRAR